LHFKSPEYIGIEVGERLESFPREDLVLARCDSANDEVAVLVRDRRFVEIHAVAILIGYEYDRSVDYRLPIVVGNNSFELPSPGTQNNFERRRSRTRKLQWLVEHIGLIETGFFNVKIGRQLRKRHTILARNS